MDKTLNLNTSDTRTHMESAGVVWAEKATWSGCRVPRPRLNKESEKEKDHSTEESHVVTKELFLVKRIDREHKLETMSSAQNDDS